jgi:hypothetical protein
VVEDEGEGARRKEGIGSRGDGGGRRRAEEISDGEF